MDPSLDSNGYYGCAEVPVVMQISSILDHAHNVGMLRISKLPR